MAPMTWGNPAFDLPQSPEQPPAPTRAADPALPEQVQSPLFFCTLAAADPAGCIDCFRTLHNNTKRMRYLGWLLSFDRDDVCKCPSCTEQATQARKDLLYT